MTLWGSLGATFLMETWTGWDLTVSASLPTLPPGASEGNTASFTSCRWARGLGTDSERTSEHGAQDMEPETTPLIACLHWKKKKLTKLALLACYECETSWEVVIHPQTKQPSDVPSATLPGTRFLGDLHGESKVKSQPVFLGIHSWLTISFWNIKGKWTSHHP